MYMSRFVVLWFHRFPMSEFYAVIPPPECLRLVISDAVPEAFRSRFKTVTICVVSRALYVVCCFVVYMVFVLYVLSMYLK